jgi:hypothetical protein
MMAAEKQPYSINVAAQHACVPFSVPGLRSSKDS